MKDRLRDSVSDQPGKDQSDTARGIEMTDTVENSIPSKPNTSLPRNSITNLNKMSSFHDQKREPISPFHYVQSPEKANPKLGEPDELKMVSDEISDASLRLKNQKKKKRVKIQIGSDEEQKIQESNDLQRKVKTVDDKIQIRNNLGVIKDSDSRILNSDGKDQMSDMLSSINKSNMDRNEFKSQLSSEGDYQDSSDEDKEDVWV